MPPIFSNVRALKAQGVIFYKSDFPQEHVEFLVTFLANMAMDDGMWEWPDHVLYGVDLAITSMEEKFGKLYTFPQVQTCIKKLNDRHVIFQNLVKTDGINFNRKSNTFIGRNGAWAKALEVCVCCYFIYKFISCLFFKYK